MKITPEPIDGGILILEEVYNSIVLRTREGNEFVICMRDDTFEMKLCGYNDRDRWYRANVKTGAIEEMLASSVMEEPLTGTP